MENPIIYVFLVILLIASSLFFQIEVLDNLNTTTWNFTGSDFASSLVLNMPIIFLGVACGVIALSIGEKMNE